MKLNINDLKFAINRLPKNLVDIMKKDEWKGKIFCGGGYIRSVITGDPLSDIDLFVCDAKSAKLLAFELSEGAKFYETENAYTVRTTGVPIQIIHRWVFDDIQAVSDSFDFTICCAAIGFNGEWVSYCDEDYYKDLAARRLVYRSPKRNEDAGGSMLRVLKYYQKGYRIPLNSLAGVISRLTSQLDTNKLEMKDEEGVAFVLTGLLREVDPAIDPLHTAHLPSTK